MEFLIKMEGTNDIQDYHIVATGIHEWQVRIIKTKAENQRKQFPGAALHDLYW